jgi:hypothetical protein
MGGRMTRSRTGPLLCLVACGLLMSAVILAVLIPKLGHLGVSPRLSAAQRYPSNPHHGWLTFWHVMLILFVSFLASIVSMTGWLVVIVRRRLANRLIREYALFEIRLSLHDEAREQDVTEMVEAWLNAVREFPEQRSRDGQPFIAIEAHYGPGPTGELEWVLCLRCEQAMAQTLDGIVSSAYPDVRVGYEFVGPPREIGGRIPRPGHVLRFRKQRSFVYPIVSETQPGAAHPLEAVAQAQVAAGVPSSVRIQMTPCALPLERYARQKLRLQETHLAAGDGGVLGTLGRAEMASATTSQSHAWCWLEVQVAGPSREVANRIASALQARRGENRLQRRWIIWRQDLYRDRFPTAYPPLLPSVTLRTLASASEVSHLVALPGARMKNVPVRRLALPRIPAPPELGMAPADPLPATPPDGGGQRT